ncbi:response regulator [Noviherbaspirillum galbum]|uniref:Response regulator n=1 Tax=Noviherbaspirillum galbum TaxID=2709383 RepID=A0A6B3SYI1_9BURK|nr:response regulator [Noviherbaspirillum galbum]NEX63039.1 response regulator [Noviherbaspirillum galbum]
MFDQMILLVDDNDDLRNSLVDLLGLHGISCTGAENGAQALALLRQGLIPGLVLLDLMMPVMNGWEFMEQALLEFPGLSFDIPVVIMSAISDHVPMPGWAAERIRKPVSFDALAAVIQRFSQIRL